MEYDFTVLLIADQYCKITHQVVKIIIIIVIIIMIIIIIMT